MNINKLWAIEYSADGTFHVKLVEDMVLGNTHMIAQERSSGHILLGLFESEEYASEACGDIEDHLKFCKMIDIKPQLSKIIRCEYYLEYFKHFWCADYSMLQDSYHVARLDITLRSNATSIVYGKSIDFQTFRITAGNEGSYNACAAMRKIRARRAG